ncbi:hypothetical protein [Mucilaginibacter flavus]|uniref:hypothetical protein n=1 Tax=Mucilaginibacter flavus TaxID=931504 RepID=UPI0025B4236B|nr:hypothetical protein [Mucilaginibacter flavus]MDN3579633.1 hypothetical protein [Mucilaginibacter flavus]
MRFNEVKKFKIDDLLLDQGNYRFKEAEDQKSCVVKIYSANPAYFKNLMSSIAEDNLGELLLVYKNGKKNIVLDGNRRLAALKVLNNPQEFSPSGAIKDHANSLLKTYTVDLINIFAQVSDDKQLIYKTVYERHAAGQGKARINWSAYGAARFRYDQKMEDGNEWYAIVLLLETESRHPEWTAFIDSSDYSHEVFRRIFKSALDKGIISTSIFSGRHQRIKTTADKLVKDAVDKVVHFLEAMRNKDISLSRSGKYADKASVDAFVEQFGLSSDNVRSQAPVDTTPATNSQSPTDSSVGSSPDSTNSNNSPRSTTSTANPSNSSNQTTASGPQQSASPSAVRDNKSYGIEQSDEIAQRLVLLKSQKLISLYRSLCVVSAVQHAQLLYIGAWSFFESLTALSGRQEGTPFDGYLGSMMNNNMSYNKTEKKDFQQILKEISDKGNANKHSGKNYSTSAIQLRADFTTLEPFIIAVIDMTINKFKKP